MMGLWNCACTWHSCQHQWPCHNQPSLHKKLKMSGLDFLVPFLQYSNSSDLNAFFQVLFSFILTVYRRPNQLMYLGALCSTGLFGSGNKCFFFVWTFQNVIPLKPMFSESLFIFLFFFILVALWTCACTWQSCQRQWSCHDQPRLHKSWTSQDFTS